MWSLKEFKSADALKQWVARNEHRVQWHEVFINNGWAVEYRPLVKPRMPR